LLKTTNGEELESVIAHEMSHIQNYGIKFASSCSACGIVVIGAQFFLRSMWLTGGKDGRRSGGGNVIFIVIGIVLASLLWRI
jgi:heat shock protein HtpX